MKIEFVFTSASKIVDKKGVIEQDGFNSFHLVPVTDKGSFDTKFDELYAIKNDAVQQQLTLINQEADGIKSQVLNMSTNLSENYLSKVELDDPAVLGTIASGIKESTATFVTTEQAGQWYGLELVTDVNGKKYVTGFDIGALVYPESSSSDSYFRINADRFIVGGDLGDGAFSTMVDANGEPIPAFAIVQNGAEPAQMYFNGKVNISGIPTVFNKQIGKFASKVLLDVYLAENPDVVVTDGDTWLDTARNIVYSWDGDEWISTGDVVKFKSTVFIRAEVKPNAPSGGTYDSPLPTSMPMWSDGVPDGTGPLWMSTATFDNKTDYTTNPIIWGDVSPLALSESVRLLFSNSLTQPIVPGYWVDDGDGTYSDSTGNWLVPMVDPVWMAISEAKIVSGNVQWGPWVVSKVKGEDGADGEQGPSGADGIRGATIARISSTTNALSYYSTTAGKTALTNSVYSIVTPDSLINGDQVIVTATDGTEIFQYSGSSWGTNTALKINGNAVINGTLYANRIVAGNLGSIVSADMGVNITATATFSTTPTTGGSLLGSITYTNLANTASKVRLSFIGRTGYIVTNPAFAGTNIGTVFLTVRDGSNTLIINGGWTPAWQDSKAMAGLVSIPAATSKTYYVYAYKGTDNASDYTSSAWGNFSAVGVPDGQ